MPRAPISASSKNAVANNSLRFVSYLGLALPNFLLALIIMLISTVLFGDSMTGLFSNEYRDAAWSMDRLLDFPLSRTCWEGGDEVNRTDVAQPGIFTTGVAIVRRW